MKPPFTEKDLAFFEDFLKHFDNVQRKSDTKAIASCPDPLHQHANRDRNPSLTLDLSQNGKGSTVLAYCQSQECPKQDILAAVGLGLKDLYPSRNDSSPKNNGRGLEGCTLEA